MDRLRGSLAGWTAARQTEAKLQRVIVEELSERFSSQVELGAFQIRFFPHIVGYGENLVLRYHGRTDVPALIRIKHFSFSVSVAGLLRPEKHIRLVRLENMVITIPPRQHDPRGIPEAGSANQPPPPRKAIPAVVVDQIVCDDTDIVILPKAADKVPLDWDIHDLTIYSVNESKPSPFHGDLTNGKPKGEIETRGKFGPWNAEDPGSTAVSGDYKFTDADLDALAGIGGTLSSTGKYSGILEQMEVTGETNTSNFSLDKVGRPVPLHTDFSATGLVGCRNPPTAPGTFEREVLFGQLRAPERRGSLLSFDDSSH
jgi:hypothetical protein